MDKKEQNKTKRQLRDAAELIVRGEKLFICKAFYYLFGNKNKWKELPSAKMLDPYTHTWWGAESIVGINNPKSARLLGIAMMLTMPDDMIDPKFLK